MTILSPTELADLRGLEAVVAEGIAAFHRVGLALREIQSRRLYLHTHTSFESYCVERWGFTRQHAFRLISASEVVDDLSPTGDRELAANKKGHVPHHVPCHVPECAPAPLPASERQARPLVPLPSQQRQEVWRSACAERATGKEQPSTARVEELARKALESLSPERKLEAVQQEEADLAARAQTRQTAEAKDARGERLKRASFHARQAVRLLEGLGGDEGQEAIGHLEQAQKAIQGLDA